MTRLGHRNDQPGSWNEEGSDVAGTKVGCYEPREDELAGRPFAHRPQG